MSGFKGRGSNFTPASEDIKRKARPCECLSRMKACLMVGVGGPNCQNPGRQYVRCVQCNAFLGFVDEILSTPAAGNSPSINHHPNAPPKLSPVPLEEHELIHWHLYRCPGLEGGDRDLVGAPYYADRGLWTQPLTASEKELLFSLSNDDHADDQKTKFQSTGVSEGSEGSEGTTKQPKRARIHYSDTPRVLFPFSDEMTHLGPSDFVCRQDVLIRAILGLWVQHHQCPTEQLICGSWWDQILGSRHLSVPLKWIFGLFSSKPSTPLDLFDRLSHAWVQISQKTSRQLPSSSALSLSPQHVFLELHGHHSEVDSLASPLVLLEREDGKLLLFWRVDLIKSLTQLRARSDTLFIDLSDPSQMDLWLNSSSPSFSWTLPPGGVKSQYQAISFSHCVTSDDSLPLPLFCFDLLKLATP